MRSDICKSVASSTPGLSRNGDHSRTWFVVMFSVSLPEDAIILETNTPFHGIFVRWGKVLRPTGWNGSSG